MEIDIYWLVDVIITNKYLVFLPRGAGMLSSYKRKWEGGEITIIDNNNADQIIVKNDYTLVVKGKFYKDNPGHLKEVYKLINKYYQEKN